MGWYCWDCGFVFVVGVGNVVSVVRDDGGMVLSEVELLSL